MSTDSDTGKVVRFPRPRPSQEQESDAIEVDRHDSPVSAELEEQPEVVEAEFVDLDAQPVDSPDTEDVPRWRQGQIERRPIVPAVLQRDNRRAAASYYSGLYTHRVAYHGIRLPAYALGVLEYTPRGAWRIAGHIVSWVTVDEAKPLKAAAVRKEDHATYLQIDRVVAPKAHARRIVLGGMAVGTVAGVTALALLTPQIIVISFVVAVLLGLGYAGRPIDRPIIGPAVVLPQQQKLTSEIVTRALQATALSSLNQKGSTVTFPQPIAMDGPGWLAVVDLPYGTTATDIIEKRDRVASGLRRPLGCVWPEQVPDHPGRLALWVGNEDMRKAKQPPWPLRRSGAVDLFRPVPFGTDQRGRWVYVTLLFASMAIGAVPRVGKTFALRQLLLIAALDPRSQIYAYDLKGTGDLSPLECVAHRYGVGDDEDDIGDHLRDMRELQVELRRRTKVILKLPKNLCPENKVTPQLADQRSYGLYPIVVGIDECQRWFENPEHGKEFESVVTDLVKRGPAVGIILIAATQRPDAKSLPTGISDNVVLRFCLRVMGQVANDMVLGTSAYKNGIRATLFTQDDKGIGYLLGEGSDAKIIRTPNINQPAAEAIALRARAMREAAGTLTGYCIGEQDPERGQNYDLLDDLQFVYAQAERRDRPGVWSVDLCAGLETLRPQVYSGWDQDTLATALKPYALQTAQIHMAGDDGERKNWRGIRREALERALAVRAERRGPRAVTGGVDD